jgi:DNA-binding response OmpR family regulator
MAGANDFIAKPFLFVELAVKALTYVLRARLDAKI